MDDVAGVRRLDHLSLADVHRDVAVPDDQVARGEVLLRHPLADVLVGREVLQLDAFLAIGPRREPAAVETLARRLAAPDVRHPELRERSSHRSGRLLVRRLDRPQTARQVDLHAGAGVDRGRRSGVRAGRGGDAAGAGTPAAARDVVLPAGVRLAGDEALLAGALGLLD